MSGPKSFAIPARFSLLVLEGRLHALFAAQADLDLLRRRLESAELRTPDGGRHTGAALLAELREELNEALRLRPSLRAPNSASDGRRQKRELTEARERVLAISARLAARLAELDALARDVDAMGRLERTLHRARLEADARAKNLAALSPGAVLPAAELPVVQFVPGLAGRERELDAQISAALERLDHALTRNPQQPHERELTASERKVAAAILALQARLESTSERALAERFAARLHALQRDGRQLTAHTVDRLHDEFLLEEETLEQRGVLLRKLNETASNPRLERMARDLLAQPRLSRREVTSWQDALRAHQAEVDRARAEREIAARERRYVQAQVIAGLEGMGYQPVDAVLVDFSQDEVFLSTPSGGDFVNLEFTEDGAVAYRYLSDAPPASMSNIEAGEAVERMEGACDHLHSVLSGLRELGVDVRLERAQPASRESILQAPEAIAAHGRTSRATVAPLKARPLEKP